LREIFVVVSSALKEHYGKNRLWLDQIAPSTLAYMGLKVKIANVPVRDAIGRLVTLPVLDLRRGHLREQLIEQGEELGFVLERQHRRSRQRNVSLLDTYRTNFGTIEPYILFLKRDFVQVY
jgi:hypothetical protein